MLEGCFHGESLSVHAEDGSRAELPPAAVRALELPEALRVGVDDGQGLESARVQGATSQVVWRAEWGFPLY
jgi:hypothetical protein